MFIIIVHHVLSRSQTQGSARTLLFTLAIHANDCCGVAWVSDTTLRHEVNVSRQRIHELKNEVEATGELTIVERPGYTNLYFVAWQGQPVGGQGSYRAVPGSTNEPGCPLRRRMPVTPGTGEGSGGSDTQMSGGSDRGCQEALTHTTRDNDTENEARPVSLSLNNGAGAPEEIDPLPPERQPSRRIRLTPGSKAYHLLYGNPNAPGDSSDMGQTDDRIIAPTIHPCLVGNRRRRDDPMAPDTESPQQRSVLVPEDEGTP
jgi:hypothetical protein